MDDLTQWMKGVSVALSEKIKHNNQKKPHQKPK